VLYIISINSATQLLLSNSTLHFRFKILLICIDTIICYIFAQSNLVNLLRRTILIIWNKIFIQNKYNFIVINFSLNNIRKLDALFKKILLIISNNFAQTISIVSKDSCIN